MMLFWVILCFASCQAVSEDIDFITIYRLSRNGYSSEGTTELHRGTNALGLPLRTRNGFFIDSVQGMPSLECSPAIENCKWTKSNNWAYSEIDVVVDSILSINIDQGNYNSHGLYRTCDDYNGGCEMFCMMEHGKAHCYCPELSIIPNNMTCSAEYSKEPSTIITSSTSFSKDYFKTYRYRWYFLPTVNTTLHLNFQTYGSNYMGAAEQNGMGFSQIMGYGNTGNETIHSQRAVKLTREQSSLYYGSDYDDEYYSVSVNAEYTRKHLTLNGPQGTLIYDMNPVEETICVSVIYKSESKSVAVDLFVTFKNGTSIQENKYQERELGQWKQKRFYAFLGDVRSLVRLSLEITGDGTVIYSINGCSPYGNQDITISAHKSQPPRNIADRTTIDNEGGCLNGGQFNQLAQKCDCPAGFKGDTCEEVLDGEAGCLNGARFNPFTRKCDCPAGFRGQICEEGCGPNSFGNNCSATCSVFDWGCFGMIFCKPHQPCRCASGYTGEECEIECPGGRYGPNCLGRCGRCENSYCDIFTGICHFGCESGYYPPFCVEKYIYPKYEPQIVKEEIDSLHLSRVFITTNPSDTYGRGKIKYYQIQYYNMEESESWVKMKPKRLNTTSESIIEEITDLSPGQTHVVRVVYFDRDGSSYQGDDVPKKVFTTNCTESISRNYIIEHSLKRSGFQVRWQYPLNTTDCPITGYQVTLRKKGEKVEFNTSTTFFDFSNLLPGNEYEVKVKAQTKFKINPSSMWYSVKTRGQAPSHVNKLQAMANGKEQLQISWLPPRFTAGTLQKYVIRYKHTMYLACSSLSDYDPSEQRETIVGANETSLILKGLHPHSVYKIEVAGITNDFIGPFTSIRGATDETEPNTSPSMSENSVVLTTNNTITVQWLASEECNKFNGYFMGYHYELLNPNNTILKDGETFNTNITFTDVMPRTEYLINVYILSSGGWNKDRKITIHAVTKATVPEEVQNLTAYKRGRREISLRWSQPVNTFGEIQSFLVSYCELPGDCKNEISVTIDPTPCLAWPNQFCYTIRGLKPNRKYSFSVRAKNNEIEEFGRLRTTTAVTAEGVPEAPLDLRVEHQTPHSITIEWKPPLMFNGILRSFLVNIEHIDSANSSNCCTYFPLQELLVKTENESFVYEVADLSPASKYTIGISSKTISIGPSLTVTVTTPPEVPMFQPARMIDNTSILIPEQEEYPGLTSTYLLIILPENEDTAASTCDNEVMETIREVTDNFYVVDEFDKSALPVTVSLAAVEEPHNGTWCVLRSPPPPEKFRVGLALVLQYNGVKSTKIVV